MNSSSDPAEGTAPQKPRLSVVMASYNEEEAIGPMIEAIRQNASAFETEIVVVDSSKDKTPEIAEKMGAKVYRQPPQGHGKALREGILRAEGDYIVTTDCDCTYPMTEIPHFVELLEKEGFDLVSGDRMNGGEADSMPRLNRIANWAFAVIVRVLYGIKTHDVTTGMFGFKKAAAHSIPWESNYAFPSEILIRSALAGFKYKEVPISYALRRGEVTLNKWRSGKAYLCCFLKYRFFPGISPDKI